MFLNFNIYNTLANSSTISISHYAKAWPNNEEMFQWKYNLIHAQCTFDGKYLTSLEIINSLKTYNTMASLVFLLSTSGTHWSQNDNFVWLIQQFLTERLATLVINDLCHYFTSQSSQHCNNITWLHLQKTYCF
jgi:hypothetical protein